MQRGQELGRATVAVLPDRGAVDAAHRVLRRAPGPSAHGATPVDPRRGDQLEQEPVGIGEGEHLLVEPAGRPLVLDPVPQQPLDPEAERRRRDGQRHGADLPRALAARAGRPARGRR